MAIQELRARAVSRRPGNSPPATPSPPVVRGVGTELQQLLQWCSLGNSSGCRCKEHAAQMDTAGPQWCRRHLSEIVGWLEQERLKQQLTGPMICYRIIRHQVVRGWSWWVGYWSTWRNSATCLRLESACFRFCARGLVRLAIRLYERKL